MFSFDSSERSSKEKTERTPELPACPYGLRRRGKFDQPVSRVVDRATTEKRKRAHPSESMARMKGEFSPTTLTGHCQGEVVTGRTKAFPFGITPRTVGFVTF
jgi:hypothetical protein